MDASEPPAPRRRVVRPSDLPRQRGRGRSIGPLDASDQTETLEVHVPDRAPAVPEIPAPRRGR